MAHNDITNFEHFGNLKTSAPALVVGESVGSGGFSSFRTSIPANEYPL